MDWHVLVTVAPNEDAERLAVLVAADVSVSGATYSEPNSVLVTVEPSGPEDALSLAESTVRHWLPDRSSALTSQVVNR